MSDLFPFEVVVDADSMAAARHRSVTGTLAVRLGSVWFPERSWNDFPVVVLGWWMREAGNVSRGVKAEFMFMDGPHRFSAYPAGKAVRVILEDCHSDPPAVVAQGYVSREALQSAICSAAEATVRACDERGWVSRDVDELRGLVGNRAAQQ